MTGRKTFTAIAPAAGARVADPIGAVLTVGRRVPGSGGAPVDTDRFFVTERQTSAANFKRRSGGDYAAIYRALHPAFAAWNADVPAGAKRQARAQFNGRLVSPQLEDCFRQHYRCDKLTDEPITGEVPGGGVWEPPPNYQPACTGNGLLASRYAGTGADGAAGYLDIPCRGELCPFRGRPDARCKRSTELLFVPEWDDVQARHLPTPLMVWRSKGEASAANAAGMFAWILRAAAGAGIPVENWYGLAFGMAITMATNPERGRRYPVVTFTPLLDIVQWTMSRRQMLEAAGAAGQLAALPPAEPAEQDVEAALLGGNPPEIDLSIPGQGVLFAGGSADGRSNEDDRIRNRDRDGDRTDGADDRPGQARSS